MGFLQDSLSLISTSLTSFNSSSIFPKLQLDLGASKIYGCDIHKQECLTSYGTQDNWFKPKKHWVMLCYSVLAQVKPTPSYHRGMTFAVMQMLCQLLPNDLHLKNGGITNMNNWFKNNKYMIMWMTLKCWNPIVILGISMFTKFCIFPN